MENASRALQIAGAVLLAVIILSLITYGFKQFGKMPESQDQQMTAEQLAKFNQEFEVYRKSKMYGVDVISCLNKAQNYNDKFVLNANDGQQTSGGFFVGTGKYGDEFKIDVQVMIKSPLSESVSFYRRDNYGREHQILDGSEVINDDTRIDDLGFKIFGNSADDSYTKMDKTWTLGGDDGLFNKRDTIGELNGSKYLEKEKYYSLLYGTDISGKNYDTDNPLTRLLRYSDKYMKQTITNRGTAPVTEWSHVDWVTALYDFKQRRFTCERIDYNDTTGQVETLVFSEVK